LGGGDAATGPSIAVSAAEMKMRVLAIVFLLFAAIPACASAWDCLPLG